MIDRTAVSNEMKNTRNFANEPLTRMDVRKSDWLAMSKGPFILANWPNNNPLINLLKSVLWISKMPHTYTHKHTYTCTLLLHAHFSVEQIENGLFFKRCNQKVTKKCFPSLQWQETWRYVLTLLLNRCWKGWAFESKEHTGKRNLAITVFLNLFIWEQKWKYTQMSRP